MKKQHEFAKIEEINPALAGQSFTPFNPLNGVNGVNVLDPGRPAARKERPKRTTIVLVSVFLSVAASMVFLIAVHRYEEPLK